MLKFFDYDNTSGYVSLYKNYLLLNKNLVDCFSDAYRIRLACDIEKGLLHLFKLSKDEALSGLYDSSSLLKLSVTKSYGRISLRSLIEFIEVSFHLDIPKDGFLKFAGKYIADNKEIIVSIKEGK